MEYWQLTDLPFGKNPLFSQIMKKTLLVLLLVIGVSLLWGGGIEPRLIEITRYRVEIPALPKDWDGKRVAFIADLQLGMWLDNEGTVRRIVDRLERDRPALVLIGGDFLYHPTEDDSTAEAVEELEKEDLVKIRRLIKHAIQVIRPLADSAVPVFAVLGNHDYAMETPESLELPWVARELSQALEEIGIPVLQNKAVPLKGENDGILFLVGIGPHYPGRDHVDKAFESIPEGAARIVMMHNPESFENIPPGAAPLAVAAHTHGGQIRIPFLPSWSWLSIVREGEIHSDGWIENFGQKGNRLYVNRGIGFSRIPIRINCFPEVTYFTLEAAK